MRAKTRGDKAWRPSKYGNVPTTVDGIRFDSKKEGFRWLQLRQLERDGQINGLQRQVVFVLAISNEIICKYRADFVYQELGKRIVEDVKGVRTDVYKIKKKLMKIILGIEILET